MRADKKYISILSSGEVGVSISIESGRPLSYQWAYRGSPAFPVFVSQPILNDKHNSHPFHQSASLPFDISMLTCLALVDDLTDSMRKPSSFPSRPSPISFKYTTHDGATAPSA